MMNWKHPWIIIPLVLIFSVILIFIGIALFKAVGNTIDTETQDDTIFCGEITGNGGEAVWERISEITQIKCKYLLPKNILHMVLLPVMIIGSITYAALSWFSKKTGILADYTYVHTIISASVSIMALSVGSIGYMISFILILAAFATPVGAIAVLLFFLGTILVLTKKIKSDMNIVMNHPSQRRTLISQHRTYSYNIEKILNKSISRLQLDAAGTPQGPALDALNKLIGELKDLAKDLKQQSEKIRQGEQKGTTDTTTLGDRQKTIGEILDKMTQVDFIFAPSTTPTTYNHEINSLIGQINAVENRLNDLNDEYKQAQADHLGNRTRASGTA